MINDRQVVLIVAPMPAFPTSAGNRRRLLSTCAFFHEAGYDIDFAYVGHEDQIYRKFNVHPPTDFAAMIDRFRRVFFIELEKPIKLRTASLTFAIDDWAPDELRIFVRWYFSLYHQTNLLVCNYVFLSQCLLQVPDHVLTLIDTHDRFGGRSNYYRATRTEPNFFYTSDAEEKKGLDRADIVIAITESEQLHFETLIGRSCELLLPDIPKVRQFKHVTSISAIGFIGHGNDANLFSIGQFITDFCEKWQPGFPTLKIAGEICKSIGTIDHSGVELMGYVNQLSEFYDEIDLVIAPIIMGTGLKMKVVEALAYGKPVIGTALAFEGLPVHSQLHRLSQSWQVVETINSMVENEALFNSCVEESKALFQRYIVNVSHCKKNLCETISKKISSTNTNLFDIYNTISSCDTIKFKIGKLTLTQITSCNSMHFQKNRNLSGDGLLIATEFLTINEQKSEFGFRPDRRRWFGILEGNASTDETKPPIGEPFNDVRLSISANLLRDSPASTAWKAAVICAISKARPDWVSTAQLSSVTPDHFGLIAQVPDFFSESATAYLLTKGGETAYAVCILSCRHLCMRPNGFNILLTPRCGTVPVVPVSMRIGCLRSAQLEASFSIFVIADGLLGRIDIAIMPATS